MLYIFLAAVVLRTVIEETLAWVNFRYVTNPNNMSRAESALQLTHESLKKALAYYRDRFRMARVTNAITTCIQLIFLCAGGFGIVDFAATMATAQIGIPAGTIGVGLTVFGLLSALSGALSLPFEWYATFVIEARHGFNRQTWKVFVIDRLKGAAVGAVLGGPLMALLIYLTEHYAASWWVLAWLALTGFSLIAVVLFPTVIAPLFNKFRPLDAKDLVDGIASLALRSGFKSAGVYVMDASKRSSHGNAYFTGLFGARRIVLFDTLVKTLSTNEALAVLAHELGHFKLNHIRWQFIRGIASTGITLWALFHIVSLPGSALAMGFLGNSPHATLILAGLWAGLIGFPLSPLGSWISRRNEFAADAYAREMMGESKTLRAALLNMREESRGIPFAHPWYSGFYYSHPPLIERLQVL